MTPPTYRASLRIRLSILFSPMRLVLCLASFAWFIVLSTLYLSHGQGADVWGPLSVIPLLAFAAWTVATDMRYRRDDTAPDDD
ncbi:hypothetical protein [Microbacterium enclense]|uniref:Uncharacterized protein n=1 Tax=Microbacterium enclense TaxID=993073 RepID=A0A1G6J386_9MICO|nr:hypothetical protein [Microbacterium enclense]KSU54731.1 hypothetical protein AS029_07200 [Microbacterium enclense]SDC13119.1 hypothetical protein SAMN05216418_1696 [Microbacterium enclense]